jgi:glycosyltransferase involved in cell wall biosynthesis
VVPPRIIFLNNYPAEPVLTIRGEHALARHHLWGIDHLARAGADVDVVPFHWSSTMGRLTGLFGGRLGDLDHQATAWRLRSGAALCYAASAREVPALAALRLAGAFDVPLAVYFFHPPSSTAWRTLLRGIDLALCLSSRTEAQLRSRFAVPSSRVATVHWGPDLDFSEFRSPDPSGDLIVCAGKTERDHDTVLTALSLSGLPGVVYLHEGASSVKPGPRTRTVAIPKGVQLPRSGVLRDLRAMRIAVVATRREIGVNGLTEVLEAMALAKPVVMTRNRYFDLDVEAIGCGKVVGPQDPEQLAAVLSELYRDPERCASMGRTGRAYLEERLNYATFGRDLLRTLRTVSVI